MKSIRMWYYCAACKHRFSVKKAAKANKIWCPICKESTFISFHKNPKLVSSIVEGIEKGE